MASSLPTQSVPEIVRIVLSELGRLHAAHKLAEADYQAKIDRLVREELTPRNLCLLTRELQDGTTRFIIKDRVEGSVCELVDCRISEERSDGLRTDEIDDDGVRGAEPSTPSGELA